MRAYIGGDDEVRFATRREAEQFVATALGRVEALARMRDMLPDGYYRQVEQLVEGQDR